MSGETKAELARYFTAIDETWPPKDVFDLGPVTLRRAQGAGMRVSSASVREGWAKTDIVAAETRMRGMGQVPSFAVRPGQAALDAVLARRGYRKCFEVVLLTASPGTILARSPDPGDLVFFSEMLLQVQRDIWVAGGHVQPPRFAVMERVRGTRTWLLGGLGNRPVATAFVALSGRVAMLHALEVHASARRMGLGALLTGAAARWAADEGAAELALLVTEENISARRLYEAMGMGIAGRYHYRMLD